MIIQCNSCRKKFNVPEAAITDSGRLVQCSSCGNKWTQFPIEVSPKESEIKDQKIDNVVRSATNKKKKKKKKITKPYSEEYLKKKYGI
ncbi:zinc-ribbon domain-containing protein, partial [Pelagibacteraceae bacterium]|nr:zinc-ribbon domain-containing protein [Pelagibacteraceae bacterium]